MLKTIITAAQLRAALAHRCDSGCLGAADGAGYNHPMPSQLTHIDPSGRAKMVDIGGKAETERLAVAKGEVSMATVNG